MRGQAKLVAMLVWMLAASCTCDGDAGEDDGLEEGSEEGSFWQLHDDSELSVTIDPWPPTSTGTSTIRASASTGDWATDETTVLTEAISYRVVSSPDAAGGWRPMTKGAQTGEVVPFTASTALPQGRQYVQFQVRGQSVGGSVELNDWAVDVQ